MRSAELGRQYTPLLKIKLDADVAKGVSSTPLPFIHSTFIRLHPPIIYASIHPYSFCESDLGVNGCDWLCGAGGKILDALAAAFPAAPDEAKTPEEGAGGGSWVLDANASWTPAVAMEYLPVIRKHRAKIWMLEQPFPLFRAKASFASQAPDDASQLHTSKSSSSPPASPSSSSPAHSSLVLVLQDEGERGGGGGGRGGAATRVVSVDEATITEW